MRLDIGKLQLMAYMSDQDDDMFPRPFLGIGYLDMGFHSTLLSTFQKRVYWGPMFNLYIFLGHKILNLCVEWRTDKPPTRYATREEMRASIIRKKT